MRQAHINSKTNSDTAVLTSNADVTMFKYADLNIRFRTPPMLEQYIKVKEWDNGYIVVTARYKGHRDVEEYIDLTQVSDLDSDSLRIRF